MTVAISESIIEASWQSFLDSIESKRMKNEPANRFGGRSHIISTHQPKGACRAEMDC
jgi:hypothetical protein